RDALFDNGCLKVKLHPWRDRRAHQADHHEEIAVIADPGGRRPTEGADDGRLPVRMREQARDDVADVKTRRRKKDLLDTAVGAVNDYAPYCERRQRHDDVARNPEELEAARHAGKFSYHVSEVGDDEREHQEE